VQEPPDSARESRLDQPDTLPPLCSLRLGRCAPSTDASTATTEVDWSPGFGGLGHRIRPRFASQAGQSEMFADNTDGRQIRLGLLACALAVSTDSAAGWMDTRNSDDRSVVVWIQTPAGPVSWEVDRDLVESLPLEQREIELGDVPDNEQFRRLAHWIADGAPPVDPCPHCSGGTFQDTFLSVEGNLAPELGAGTNGGCQIETEAKDCPDCGGTGWLALPTK
jgi:hypothetical protein